MCIFHSAFQTTFSRQVESYILAEGIKVIFVLKELAPLLHSEEGVIVLLRNVCIFSSKLHSFMAHKNLFWIPSAIKTLYFEIQSLSFEVTFSGQTLPRNTLYVPLKRFPLPILRDWRRVEIIKRSTQMICKDHRRLDPCLKAWPSFCATQREESTNLIFLHRGNQAHSSARLLVESATRRHWAAA